MVRILNLSHIFSNGINDFLKAKRALKMTNVLLNLSQIHKQWPKSMKLCVIIVWIRMNAETVNANREIVGKILHDELNINKFCAMLVPKALNPDQKLIHQ